jgi:hypothetical protein
LGGCSNEQGLPRKQFFGLQRDSCSYWGILCFGDQIKKITYKEIIMKKITVVISSIFFTALFIGIVNASEYEQKERGEYYEHGERYENEFYGTVQQIPENFIGTWIIDGKNIQVNRDTYIEREYGQPGVGSYVEVEGRYIDNTFIARKIKVKRKQK